MPHNMSIFRDFELKWKDQTYTLKGTEIFQLITKIESEVITVPAWLTTERLATQLNIVSRAYAIVLQHVGAEITLDEAYYAVMHNGAQSIVDEITLIMVPPKEISKGPAPKKKRTTTKA